MLKALILSAFLLVTGYSQGVYYYYTPSTSGSDGSSGGVDPNSIPYKYYLLEFISWNSTTEELAEFQLYDVTTGLPVEGSQSQATEGLRLNNSTTATLSTDGGGTLANLQDNQFWTGWNATDPTYVKVTFTNIPSNPVASYGITSGFAADRMCNTFKLYGSLDDATYVLLDERAGVTTTLDSQWRVFIIGE